jgi:hypothetical protein
MWPSFGTGIILAVFGTIVSVVIWSLPHSHLEVKCAVIKNTTILQERRAVGFYHLWMPDDATQKDRLDALLNVQLGVIVNSAMIAETRELYVKIMCPTESLRLHAEALVRRRLNLSWLVLHIEHISTPVDSEAGTINVLNAYCKHEDASDFIWYVHDKGAFHATAANTKIMPVATASALSAGCRDQLENHGADICGMRWVRYPHAHFAASNMWVAKCSYIARLPNVSEAIRRRCAPNGLMFPNGTFAMELATWACGCDRYAAEHWIGLGATFVQAADCVGYRNEADGTVRTYFRDYLNLDFDDYGSNCSLAPKPELELAFETGRIPDYPQFHGSDGHRMFIAAKKMNLLVDAAHFLEWK